MPSGVYLHRKNVGSSWNKGLTKESDPRVARMAEGISKSLKGCPTWNKGLTKDTDNRLLEASKKQSIMHTGKHQLQKTKSKLSEATVRQWKDPICAEKMMTKSLEANLTIRPNKLEEQVIKILKLLSSGIKYVGDGSHWILGTGKNPDFVNEEKKQIIEVYGCYWHCCKKCGHPNRNKRRQKDASRINNFKDLGYSVLIIWEHELREQKIVAKKIMGYCA
jgi:G:T-mismatch repair DNA endonuclease (very short patch repair protein)